MDPSNRLPRPARSEATLGLLQTRRTVPSASLGDPGPSLEELDQMVTIAMRVPDHGKLAPWRFIALDRAARALLAPKLQTIRTRANPDVDPTVVERQLEVFQKAPLCLIVVARAQEHVKIPIWEQELSVGASTMNLMLAAHALGYGAQWLTGWTTYHAEAKAFFGVDPEEKIAGFIHIGTAHADPSERPRPALTDHLTQWAPG